jgi:predicted AlkP superfamily pyrophosphatase or phosphodiesterase
MSARLLVIDVVGLVPALVGPRLAALAEQGWSRTVAPVFPAVTCTAQASMLTGGRPADHGIVGNGWYEHELSEVLFWRQSNRLVQGSKVWETARLERPDLKVAKLFWWYNMYSSADVAVTPRPEYPADGRKIPGVYTQPYDLRARLEQRLGPFPLFRFWGPAADLSSTRWITDASLDVLERDAPDLALVYLPHLDYVLQRQGPEGPDVAAHARDVDEQAGRLVDAARNAGMEVLIVSEYGIGATREVVFPNRALAQAGLLSVLWQDSVGETLDAGASRAFAVCDHQVAHVYVADPADRARARAVLEGLAGVAAIAEGEQRRQQGLDHRRAGDLILTAEPHAWFAYPYWQDDSRAPDFARTVDIHRKPGYDPAELFLDPALRFPKLRIARRLLAKKLGFRALLDVIPLDPSLVAGSHGHVPCDRSLWPQLIGTAGVPEPGADDDLRVVHDLILSALLERRATGPGPAEPPAPGLESEAS